jgi:hypothetical protein
MIQRGWTLYRIRNIDEITRTNRNSGYILKNLLMKKLVTVVVFSSVTNEIIKPLMRKNKSTPKPPFKNKVLYGSTLTIYIKEK